MACRGWSSSSAAAPRRDRAIRDRHGGITPLGRAAGYARRGGEGAAAQAEEERKANAAAETEARAKAEQAEKERLAAVQAEEERKAKAAAEAEAQRRSEEAERQRLDALRAEEEGRKQAEAEARTRYSALMSQGHTDINNGDYDRAIAAFSAAMRLDPKSPLAFTNRRAPYQTT